MSMILTGNIVANSIKVTLKEEIEKEIENGSRPPCLVIISVGEDPASKVYVRNKIKVANELGIVAKHITFEENVKSFELINTIQYYNNDRGVDGIMVQLPLPECLNEREIIEAIAPKKDVDGLTYFNIGRLRAGDEPYHKPCTAKGIMDLLKYYNISVDHKDVTIIGRSNIVGKPIADMMMAEGATITHCHSHTNKISYCSKMADIVVCAVGKPNFLTSKDFWDTEAVIDVGINRDENGKLCGDVDFDDVMEVHGQNANFNITPVPGGIGPMTVVELMSNTVDAWRENKI